MVTVQDVGWGKYEQWSGPVYWGSKKVSFPGGPKTEAEKMLAVVCQTEGGKWDATQAYDRCIFTAGSIQFCEGYFSVSSLLGYIGSRDKTLLEPLRPALEASQATFEPNRVGVWRFHLPGGVEVGTAENQRDLFFEGASGLLKDWTSDTEEAQHAKLWVASVANVLQQEEAIELQKQFTLPKLKGFAWKEASTILFGEKDLPSEGWVGALRSAYTSYAANNSVHAYNGLISAMKANPSLKKWSPEWCQVVLQALVFGPQIAIYPGRYDKIRPVIESLYGVDLPDFAKDLKAWKISFGIDPKDEAPILTTVADFQKALVDLGYDLGPAGIDNKMGRKTVQAIKLFQGAAGLSVDGILGPKTRSALLQSWGG